MKAITFKTLAFLALAANVILFSCKKKDDTPTPTTTNNSTTSDTLITKTDTIWTAAGDSGSRSFLNGDGVVYTGDYIGIHNMGPTIVLGYDFNTDSSSGGSYYGPSITDVYAYPVPNKSWLYTTTNTYFKTITDTAGFSVLTQAGIESWYNTSTATPATALYKVSQGQVIAFMNTGSNKYGVLRVNKIVTVFTGTTGNPPTSPYSTYLIYSLIMEI